jgi:cytochrome c oxidase cbb3-type subunit 2
MPYRMTERWPLLGAYDRNGILYQHYNPAQAVASSTARVRGPILEWLNPVQREHFLRLGAVEEIGVEQAPAPLPEPEPEPEPEPIELQPQPAVSELVDECVADLNLLGVQQDAGAPNARRALRESGRHYGNETVMLAVRARKAALA